MDQRSGIWRTVAEGVQAYDGPAEDHEPPSARPARPRGRRPPRGSGRRRRWSRPGSRAGVLGVVVLVVAAVLVRAGEPGVVDGAPALGGVAGPGSGVASGQPFAAPDPAPEAAPEASARVGSDPAPEASARVGSDPARSAVGARAADVTDWVAVLSELDRRRADAFARVDPGALRTALADGSTALGSDGALLSQLESRGLRALGLSTRVLAADVISSGADEAVLRVLDQREAYQLVDDSGHVEQDVPAAPQRLWEVRLRPVEATGDPDGAQRESDPGPALGSEAAPAPAPGTEADPGWRVAQVTALAS